MNKKRVLPVRGGSLVIALCFGMMGLGMVLFPQAGQAYTTRLYLEAPSRSPIEILDQYSASESLNSPVWTDFYGYTQYGSAFGSFDLATGELKFTAEAQGVDGDVYADLYVSETIFPEWVSGEGTMDITVKYTVTGTYQVAGAPGTMQNLVLQALFSAGVGELAAPWQGIYDQYNLTDGIEAFSTILHFDPSLDTSIVIGTRARARLDPFNGVQALADFSQTGIIELELPEGAAFTSASGVFLTGNVVPIPSAVWLLGSGLIGLAGIRRRFSG